MPTLHLGVVDLRYTNDGKSTTTGEVASYLEADYHVMRTFVELNEQFIADEISNQIGGMIEKIAQGVKVDMNESLSTKLGGQTITGTSFASKIEERFRDFLAAGEMNRLLPISQRVSDATLKKSSRMKDKKNKNGRQAFVDTGLYSASFRAWVTR